MDEAAEGTFQIIDGLTRINHDSPYSKQHPIRKIDNIQKLVYPKEGYCGQTCIAMLTAKRRGNHRYYARESMAVFIH